MRSTPICFSAWLALWLRHGANIGQIQLCHELLSCFPPLVLLSKDLPPRLTEDARRLSQMQNNNGYVWIPDSKFFIGWLSCRCHSMQCPVHVTHLRALKFLTGERFAYEVVGVSTARCKFLLVYCWRGGEGTHSLLHFYSCFPSICIRTRSLILLPKQFTYLSFCLPSSVDCVCEPLCHVLLLSFQIYHHWWYR